MNPAIENLLPATPPCVVNIFYDLNRKEYLVPDSRGEWLPLNETQFKRVLKQHGFSSRASVPGMLSPQDEEILKVQQEQSVHFAGPLAGYERGHYDFGQHRVLVTSSPQIIEPADGDFPTIRRLLTGLLGDGPQLLSFYGWVKIAYTSLRAHQQHPGQALILVGPHNSGKSVLQNILTIIFGGRAAKPYQFMTGGTGFNSDMFGAEHLMIEDESPSTDMRARRAFGAQIKNMTVCEVQRLHAKHRDALVMKPFWRLSVSLNDEPENVMVLPPIDESIADKLMIFKTERNPMPMPTTTLEERAAFWNKLMSELPAFLNFLIRWEIPIELRSPRFGITHYHHPEVLSILDEMAPEYRLLNLIDDTFFSAHELIKTPSSMELTAEQIEGALTSHLTNCSHEARKLFSWPAACGTYLGRLAKKRPDRVKSHRTAESRLWVLHAGAPASEAA